jgi:hypothetical protein
VSVWVLRQPLDFEFVMAGLDPAIHLFEMHVGGCAGLGKRSDAVLRTAMPAHDAGI